MKLSPQTVANVLPDNRKSAAMSFGDYRLANHANTTPRRQGIDGCVQTIKCTLRYCFLLIRNLTDQKGFALVYANRQRWS